LPKALVPGRKNLEYLMRKQYVHGYMVFFNINICRNNLQDVRQLTEFAREHRVATDYHINETPMLEQDEHFKHMSDNPTYIRPQDWRDVDALVDWLVEKNEAGYQMVNSVPRLQEIKAFIRMASGSDLKRLGWNGDGTGTNGDIAKQVAGLPGFVQDANGELQFAEWNCRAGQNNVIIRTDGTVAPCFPMYPSSFDWGNIERPKFDQEQLRSMKSTCQQHCFSTLNHNLSYCYNDARVIRFVWTNLVKKKAKGGAQSFDH
jgi:radical SAM protein with 4Fe4S-binding SPASM domain